MLALRSLLFVALGILAASSAMGQLQSDGSCPVGLLKVCSVALDSQCICVAQGDAAGDPMFTGFDGRPFEFLGEPEAFYNVYSDAQHQVTMKLFEGKLDNHTGTYMGGIGFQYNRHTIVVSLQPSGDITVEAGEDKTAVDDSAAGTFRVMESYGKSDLSLITQPFRPGFGHSVDIKTDTLELNVWAVAPGSVVDTLGQAQPAYLNFNVTLHATPAGGDAQGILGETIRLVAAKGMASVEAVAEAEGNVALVAPKVVAENDYLFHGQGPESSYKVGGYFDTDFDFNLFRKPHRAVTASRRSLLKHSAFKNMVFPRVATARVSHKH